MFERVSIEELIYICCLVQNFFYYQYKVICSSKMDE